jgi:hypothetical protein
LFWDNEVAMKTPSFRIAWLMVAVAIAALDVKVMRDVVGSRSSRNIGLVLGSLPMVNALAVGVLFDQRRRACRWSLLGFEVFGAISVALYIALWSNFDYEIERTYLKPLIDLLQRTIGQDHPNIFIPILYVGVMLMVGLPQLALALVGGFLTRTFNRTLFRR